MFNTEMADALRVGLAKLVHLLLKDKLNNPSGASAFGVDPDVWVDLAVEADAMLRARHALSLRPHGEIWAGCPVTPLGNLNDYSYYRDADGVTRKVSVHTSENILRVFGRHIPDLCQAFPVWEIRSPDERPRARPYRFDAPAAAMVMIQACSERGLYKGESDKGGP